MTYPTEVRSSVIADYLSGVAIAAIAHKHSINPSTITNWAKAAGVQRGTASNTGLCRAGLHPYAGSCGDCHRLTMARNRRRYRNRKFGDWHRAGEYQ